MTAFLPNTYPIGEQDEDAEAKAKRHGKLKILLLENINVDASDFLKKQGYEVSHILLSGFRFGDAVKWKDSDGLLGIGVGLTGPRLDVWALRSYGPIARPDNGKSILGSWAIGCLRELSKGFRQ